LDIDPALDEDRDGGDGRPDRGGGLDDDPALDGGLGDDPALDGGLESSGLGIGDGRNDERRDGNDDADNGADVDRVLRPCSGDGVRSIGGNPPSRPSSVSTSPSVPALLKLVVKECLCCCCCCGGGGGGCLPRELVEQKDDLVDLEEGEF
jgi:hypothetical protein